MAGDWVKIENTTPDKPEVFVIADCLDIDPDAVVGKLFRVWIWADQQTYNGNAGSVTVSLLDRITGVTGFAKAMIKAGWLREENGGLVFSNFERHNGNTAKTRATTAKRVKSHRAKCNAPTVTEALPEKRRDREEKSKEKPPKSPKGDCKKKFIKPTVNEVAAYCAERRNRVDAQAFVDFYESKGWMIGKSPMKDWTAAVRTWEKNSNGHHSPSVEATLRPLTPPKPTVRPNV